MTPPPAGQCWCGSTHLRSFSADYAECETCGTLVRIQMPHEDLTAVADAPSDLYGRSYYEKHLVDDLGQPEIGERMRSDLTERCLHWLRTVRRYAPRGGRLLEIGCGHGGSLALFQAAGLDTTGLELSPWLVELARRTWGTKVLAGPVEKQSFPPHSFEIIALFDVLEHLQDPVMTMRTCASLLAPGGCVIIQTPEHVSGRTYDLMVQDKHPFLSLLIPEHLFLFTRSSIALLLERAGLPCAVFEPAMFPRYDQYLVCSPETLPRPAENSALTGSMAARLVQGLLDLDDRCHRLATRLSEVEPFELEVRTLHQRLADLDSQVRELNAIAAAHQSESAARYEQIQQLTALHAAQADAQPLRAQIEMLTALARRHEADAGARLEQIETLTALVHRHQTDSAERLQQINRLGQLVAEFEKIALDRHQQIETLTTLVHRYQTESAERARQIETLTARAGAAPS